MVWKLELNYVKAQIRYIIPTKETKFDHQMSKL
jgi:hypothetical protein